MTSFVETGLGNALVALVLAVVALVVGLVCRRPAVVHALWLLVLLKLVTPPLVSIPLPWPTEEAAPREETPVAIVIDDSPVEFVEEPPLEWAAEFPATEAFEPVEESPTPEIPGPGASWETVFGLAWLTGSLAWCAIAAQRLFRFGRLLRHSLPPPDHLTQRVAALAEQLGLRRPPRILLVPGHLSPMVWAMGRVTLLVPAKLVTQMSGPALDTLLAHELAHIRRRDHWVRWLELVGLGLYWWNPVVWLARRELRQAEELCCDAWVVRCLPDARRVYATALVDALDFLSRPDEPLPMLGCGLGRVDDLKWRLTMILRGKTSPRLGWTTALGVFGLAVLLLPLVPSLSPAQPKPNPPKTALWGVEELDPDSRAEIQAMIEKLVAEARAKKVAERAQDMLRHPKSATTTQDQLRALEVEIKAKTVQMQDLKKKLEATPSYGFDLKVTPARPSEGVTIRIEIGIKGSPQEIKATLEKIEKALAEQKKSGTIGSVRIISQGESGPKLTKSGTTIWLVDPPTPSIASQPEKTIRFTDPTGTTPAKVLDPNAPAPKSDPFAAPTTQPNRRIDALEKKLDQVLKELEALRKSKTAPKKGTWAHPAPTVPQDKTATSAGPVPGTPSGIPVPRPGSKNTPAPGARSEVPVPAPTSSGATPALPPTGR